jgi:hypothetical protein
MKDCVRFSVFEQVHAVLKTAGHPVGRQAPMALDFAAGKIQCVIPLFPLTADGRLSARDIVGSRKKLSNWQDEFWALMAAKYPDFERGESTGETGRDHIPPRVFREMAHLTKQKEKPDELLAGVNPFNARSGAADISSLLDSFLPAAEKMSTQLKKYRAAFQNLAAENRKLIAENAQLAEKNKESVVHKLAKIKLRRDYAEAAAVLERIPPEIAVQYGRW